MARVARSGRGACAVKRLAPTGTGHGKRPVGAVRVPSTCLPGACLTCTRQTRGSRARVGGGNERRFRSKRVTPLAGATRFGMGMGSRDDRYSLGTFQAPGE